MPLARLFPLLAFAAVAACSGATATGTDSGGSTAAPTPGWLTVQLTTPNSNDGAVQFAVSGPGIDSVLIVGYDGFAANDAGTVNVVVDGDISNGTLARLHVTDVSLAAQYQASVTAVAVRDTYALQSTSGYRVVLVR